MLDAKTPEESMYFVSALGERRNDFLSASEKYLIEKEVKLNQVIYSTMSLEDIKELYAHGD